MRVVCEPSLNEWPLDRVAADTPVWTGHQATLWHPGIFAKYLAADAAAAAAASADARVQQVVVDQDTYHPLRFELPVRDGDRVRAVAIELAPVDGGVPPGCQPPADHDALHSALTELIARHATYAGPLKCLRAALLDPTDARPATLAEQSHRALRRLADDLIGGDPLGGEAVYATKLLVDPARRALIERMVDRAEACVAAYNRAVAAEPRAGITPLRRGAGVVELPLWRVQPGQPRRRVYVDLDAPELPHPWEQLAPRALLLTAMLRAPARSAVFIHGSGGGVYDRVTEQWWDEWTGERLAPMAVVTADLHLDFGDLPIATRASLAEALWYRHHLPHNIDRELPEYADPSLTAEKRGLLAHMDDDRDRDRRRTAFDRLHAINRRLAEDNPEAVDAAGRAVNRARAGVANAGVAGKRDWPFFLYPAEALRGLRRCFAARPPAPGPPYHKGGNNDGNKDGNSAADAIDFGVEAG